MGAAAALSDALILNAGLVQSFAQTYAQDAVTMIGMPDSTVTVFYSVYDRPWKNELLHIRAELIHQIKGSFDSRIMIDDYRDYYRHLLFEGQQRNRLSFRYVRTPAPEVDDKDARLSIDFARGFAGNVELEVRADYWWSRKRLYYYAFGLGAREEITWSVGLRWRSFDYTPGRGPGWDRDSRADFIFGPVIPAGNVYLNLEFQPPGWADEIVDDGGFLSFSGLESDDFVRFYGESVFGLGAGTEVGGSATAALITTGSRDTYFGDAAAFFRTRILGAYEVRIAYTQTYHEARHDPAEFSVNLAGIF